MSLMDKILDTALLMWGISMMVGVLTMLIGAVAERDVIVKASIYFVVGLIGLVAIALGIWGLAGIGMYLQEMWG